jgi:hypothetical protein
MHIKLWKNKDSFSSYIITEDDPGPGLDQTLKIKHQIRLDDNINMFMKKISIYMAKYVKQANENEIYMWIERKVIPSHYIFLNFINNVFKNEKRIDSIYFIRCVNNYFKINQKINWADHTTIIDKHDAINMLLKAKNHLTIIIEPLLFKYTNNGFFEYINYNPLKDEFSDVSTLALVSYETSTLESLGISESDTINMITTSYPGVSNVFFPFKDQTSEHAENLKEFVTQLDKIEKDIYTMNVEEYKHTTYINFLQLRGNELTLNTKVNLIDIFDTIRLSDSIPYSKYKTKTNIYHKMYKQSVVDLKDSIIEWSNTNMILTTNKMINSTSLMYKIRYPVKTGIQQSFCTLTLFDDLSYDVKFNFGMKQKEELENVYAFFEEINTILQQVQKIYPKHQVELLNTTDIRMVQVVTVNTISLENKKIKYENLEQAIKTKLFPFFNIINNPDKSILHLQYKKVENYTKYDNIQAYITNHFTSDKNEMIERIMKTFTMSKESAEKEYEKWSMTNEVEVLKQGENIIIKPKSANFINVKIKLDPSLLDLKFIVYGIKDLVIQERITNLIKCLLELSKKKLQAGKLNTDQFEKMAFEKKIEGTAFNEIEDEVSVEETGETIELDEDLLALEAEFLGVEEFEEDPKPVTKPATKPAIIDGTGSEEDKVKGYILNKLYEADEGLFKYPVPPGKKRKDYASVCQWTARQQPIVVSQDEYEKINKEFPSALEGFVKTGTTEDKKKKNLYVCPKIWCPISRVAMTYQDYLKHDKKCPYPNVEEDPILFESKNFWGLGEAGLKRGHYPGFLDPFSHHPDKLCLPCCYKLQAKEGTRHKQRIDYCMPPDKPEVKKEEKQSDDIVGNERYIKADDYYPLEPQRFGLIPTQLADLFGSNVCGNRHDGTGLINEETDCVLRRGVKQQTQSFLSCVMSLLDNSNITDVQSFVNIIVKNLSIEQFISLENGKLMKLFIVDKYDIYNKDHYNEFKKWFLSQTAYISKFLLSNIAKDIEKHDIFDKNSMIYYRDITREFLIFNSFKHFKEFIYNPNVNKDHFTLLDLISSDLENININGYNFIIIDTDHKKNKFYINCPLNRNAKSSLNMKAPFIFIIKNDKYYEPIVSVKIDGHTLVSTSKFSYKDNIDVQKIVDFYLQNCDSQEPNKKNNVALILESLGFKVKASVIDYSFRCKGILLNNNLYIPFENTSDLLEIETNTKFVYISDIVKYKCRLQKDELKNIFSKLHEINAEFYTIKNYVMNKDNTQLLAIILAKDILVPLMLTQTNILYKSFENDLDIFINIEKDDIRTATMKIIEEKDREFKTLFNLVLDHIEAHTSIKNEIMFLLDPRNPFPKSFKRNKILTILKGMKLAESLDKLLVEKVSEMILNNHTLNFYILSHKFQVVPNEIILEHSDIQNNVLTELIEYEKNPYRMLQERLDTFIDVYVFTKPLQYDTQEDMFAVLFNDSTLEDVQVKWRKVFGKGVNLLVSKGYNNMYLYKLFTLIMKFIDPKKYVNESQLKAIVKTHLVADYEKGNLEEFKKNPSYSEHLKKLKITDVTLDDYLSIFDSVFYYPSLYEIKILSKIVGITLFITRRKTKADKDDVNTVIQINKKGGKNKFLLLSLSFDRFNNRDVFDVYTKDGRQIVLSRKDISDSFWSVITSGNEEKNV